MKKSKNEKTNVMRLFDQHKVEYDSLCYADTDAISGMEVATVLGEDPNQLFKTLVAVGKSKTYYVFMVPVNKELSLRKAAAVVGEKNMEMIRSKELLPLTGYVHGGCSPVGMKKQFTTVIHNSAAEYDRITFSAGKIGYQVRTSLQELEKVLRFILSDIVE